MTGLYNFLLKRGQLIALLIGVVFVAIILISIFGGLGSAGYDAGTDLNAILKDGGGNGFNFFNPAMLLPILLTILCAGVWLIFGLGRVFTNPKGSISGIIAAAVIFAIFFFLYTTSVAETTGRVGFVSEKFNISEGISKLISGGLKTTIGLTILSIVAMVAFEIYSLFK